VSGKGRRPHGDGSIFVYRKGYAAVLDVGWVNGQRRRRWVYGPTEAEVLRKLNEAKRQLSQGVNLTLAPQTMDAWLNEWLSLKVREGTRPSTIRDYRWLIESHIRPTLGRVKLTKITPTMIRRLLDAKTDEGLSTATVRHVHGLIRNVLSDAEREELTPRNVAKLVRPPALHRSERRGLSMLEARRLIEVVEGDRLEALWLLCVEPRSPSRRAAGAPLD